MEIRRFPAPVLEALHESATAVLEEQAANDPIFKEAYESILSYRDASRNWNELQVLTVKE